MNNYKKPQPPEIEFNTRQPGGNQFDNIFNRFGKVDRSAQVNSIFEGLRKGKHGEASKDPFENIAIKLLEAFAAENSDSEDIY